MGNEEVDLVTVAKPQENRSLLLKYDIPVEHLSYEHISQCKNVKEIERIVLILRSGEEGIFPDLISHAEKRLRELSPNSKILRVEEPVLTRAMLDPEDRKIIDEDIAEWMSEMQGREKDLEEGKTLSLNPAIPQPEIRQTPEAPVKRLSESRKKTVKPKSIASCDYSSWDKFDADAELDRIDLQEEKKQVEAKDRQRKQREKNERAKRFSRDSVVDKLALTATELTVMAEQEKNIGNEAFRAGDYEEALTRYNSSISMNSSVNAYNNRAITNIKLQRYEDAVNDCNVVLSMEYSNVTALMRRGLALERLEKKSEALIDYETILKLEPNNKTAIAAVNKLSKPSESKKVRMKIEEESNGQGEKCCGNEAKEPSNVRSNDLFKNEVSEICFCDRAPGFSKSPKPPPHYKSSYCLPLPFDRQKPKILGHSKSQSSYFDDVKKTKSNSRKVIIEELPNDETIVSGKKADKKDVRKPVVIVDDCIKSNRNNSEKEKVTKLERVKKKSEKEGEEIDEQSKTKIQGLQGRQKKIIDVASKYENIEKMVQPKDFNCAGSPYEFLHVWQSLKNDVDLFLRAKLLRSLTPEDLDSVIGNKLDGNMFSIMLRCLERHFVSPQDVSLVHRYLTAFTKLSRFSIVHLFMDLDDKQVLKKLISFVEDEENSSPPKVLSPLRRAYNV